MKILCVGDSLALPREGCTYEESWFYKLSKYYEHIDFVAFFKRGLRISETRALFDLYYCDYFPNYVIIQTGICDCAPRYINAYNLYWKYLIKAFALIGLEKQFWTIIKSVFSRRKNCVYTEPQIFERYYDDLVQKFLSLGVEKILIVKIGHASNCLLDKNPGFNSNVDTYNLILQNIADKYKNNVVCIHPLDDVNNNLFVDGYHCNSKGMDVVYESLKRQLSIWLRK